MDDPDMAVRGGIPGATWPSFTHKQLETHGGMISSVATDALVLKHQAISIYSAD